MKMRSWILTFKFQYVLSVQFLYFVFYVFQEVLMSFIKGIILYNVGIVYNSIFFYYLSSAFICLIELINLRLIKLI